MNILETLRDQGFTLAAVDGRISITPANRLTQAVRDLIKEHKQELLFALAAQSDLAGGDTPRLSMMDLPTDLFETLKERASIRHHDGGLSWKEAEAEALAEIMQHYACHNDKYWLESTPWARTNDLL